MSSGDGEGNRATASTSQQHHDNSFAVINGRTHGSVRYVVDKDLCRPSELDVAGLQQQDGDTQLTQRQSSLSPVSSAGGNNRARSPGPRVTVVPRSGSFQMHDSFRRMRVEKTEAEKKQLQTQRRGPASQHTVVALAGLLCVGIMFLSSGVIIVSTKNNNESRELYITGWVFFAIGCLMIIACGFVQRKNWVRYMDQMDQNLYFLQLGRNPIFKLMKLDIIDLNDLGFSHKKYNQQQKDAAAAAAANGDGGGGGGRAYSPAARQQEQGQSNPAFGVETYRRVGND